MPDVVVESSSERVVGDDDQGGVLATLRFNADGLIPAIAQQFDTREVLMMAWMNRVSLVETLRSGVACYWSRSRGRLWRKGETSGHVQRVRQILTDCDRDTLLLMVDQTGVACHTGRRSCFGWAVEGQEVVEVTAPELDPAAIYPVDAGSGAATR